MALEDKNTGVLHGKYELGRQLGHGTFAKVYHAKNVHAKKSVAMKVVGKEKVIQVGMMEQIKREILVMKMVRHPNIVELYEVMASKSKIYFAMEHVRGGELFGKIAKGRLREDVTRSYFQQLISAVDFCHSRGVYHRDLKPENLLLDEEGNLKVTDFGLSAFCDHLRQDGLLHTTCRTPAYVAPEILGKKGYDGAKADIWLCGVILYVLLAGFLPFQDENIVSMYRKIYRGDFKCPPWFSSYAHRLITKLLDPKKREEKEEMRFATTEPATAVVSKLEAVAKSVKFSVRKSSDDSSLRLQGHEVGRKGKLGIAVEIFAVTPSFLVVEVKKCSGDTLEYNQFCSKELRPALSDIVWRSASGESFPS